MDNTIHKSKETPNIKPSLSEKIKNILQTINIFDLFIKMRTLEKENELLIEKIKKQEKIIQAKEEEIKRQKERREQLKRWNTPSQNDNQETFLTSKKNKKSKKWDTNITDILSKQPSYLWNNLSSYTQQTQTHNQGMNHKFIKSVLMTGTALLIFLKPGVSKGNDAVKDEIQQVLKTYPAKEIVIKEVDQKTKKMAKFETLPGDTINALDFAVQNVDKYYPDMKEHLNTMINSFRDEEHKEATIKLLNKMTANISDPKTKTGLIIGVLEFSVFYKSTFGDIYGNTFSDEIFWLIEKFDTDYKTRFKWYYKKLEEKTEQLKKEIIIKQQKLQESQQKLQESQQKLQESQQELEKGRQELEAVMLKFSPEDVKNNAQIKKLVLQTKQRFKDNNFIPSTKVQELFDATK